MNFTLFSFHLASLNSVSPFLINSPRKHFTQHLIRHSFFSRSFSNVLYFHPFRSSFQVTDTKFAFILQSAVVVRNDDEINPNCTIFPSGYAGSSAVGYKFTPDSYDGWDDHRPFVNHYCPETFSFINCIFEHCYARFGGGALHFDSDKNHLIMKSNTFIKCKTTIENEATFGGGIRIQTAQTAELSSCCFIDCTGPKQLIGSAIASFCHENITLNYVGSVNSEALSDSTQRTNGPPFHIEAGTVESDYINSTGAKSYKASGINYYKVTKGHLKFHTISKCLGHNIISLLSVKGTKSNDLSIQYFNIESNVVDDNWDGYNFLYVTSSTHNDIIGNYHKRISYIWIEESSYEDLKISSFYFTKNEIKISDIGKLEQNEIHLYNEFAGGNLICNSSFIDEKHDDYSSFYSFRQTESFITQTSTVEIELFPSFRDGECGIPTNSDVFSYSESFSLSNGFTETDGFTHTTEFSQSTGFSQSTEFSQSTGFSESNTPKPSYGFSIEPPEGLGSDDKGMPKGALIGIIVGVIIVVLIIIAIVILVIRRKRKPSTEEPSSEMNSMELQGVHTNDSIHVNDENNDDPFKEDYHEVHADPFIAAYND